MCLQKGGVWCVLWYVFINNFVWFRDRFRSQHAVNKKGGGYNSLSVSPLCKIDVASDVARNLAVWPDFVSVLQILAVAPSGDLEFAMYSA